MEHGFEERLHAYGDAAKLQLDIENSDGDDVDPEISEALTALDERLDAVSEQVLRDRHAHPKEPESILEKEQKVKDIQLKKQRIMQELRSSLRLLDEPGRHQVGDAEGYSTRYIDGQLQVSGNEDDWQDMTVGEMVTDQEWGAKFRLKSGKMPRGICKQYLVERAKYELSGLLDEQIMIDQTSDRFIDTGKRIAYESLLKEREEIPRFGHVAEVMSKNFLTKLRLDHGLDVEVQLGDAYHDVEQKIDFMIRRTNHVRGVTLEENSQTESIAIQITINDDEDVLKNKAHQVDKSKRQLMREGVVDDMALVLIGQSISAEMRLAYDSWKRNKAPGGPDKLLSSETQELLFRTILDKMYTSEELEQRWQNITKQKAGTTNA